jgi:dUTP pyrophosphatase
VLINHDPENAYQVRVGDRIAQLVVMRIENINFLFSESLDDSERGTGGFGHSGS